MRPGFASGVPRSRRLMWITLTVAILALTALPVAQGAAATPPPFAASGASSSAALGSASLKAPTSAGSAHAAALTPATSGATMNLTFFQNATVPSGFAESNMGCHIENELIYGYEYRYCYNSTVNPTLVPLGGSSLGVSYQVNTNITQSHAPTCLSSVYNYSVEVGFSRSTNNGSSWSPPVIIANRTCAYTNSLEPSFAASGPDVYGVFVEDNETQFPYGYPYGWSPPGSLPTRNPSTLGFVNSSNGGGTFSPVVSLPSGSYVAHPEVAVVGHTIYVVYENISNTTSTVETGGPYCCYYYDPVAVEFMDSTNGGVSWSTPVKLPGLNSTAGYFSVSPSIAVNATGTLAVSYFTNNTCVWNEGSSYYYYYSYCEDYGMDLVVVTSSNNGSTWSPLTILYHNVGLSMYDAQFSYYDYGQLPANWIPQSQLRFSPDGSTVLVAFDGVYDTPNCCTNPYYYYAASYLAMGPSAGTGPWNVQILAEDNSTNTEDSFIMPAVGESPNGTIYFLYEWMNDTYCYGASPSCPYMDGTISWRLLTSYNDGVSWAGPTILNVLRDTTYYSEPYYWEQDYQGFETSIGFSATGSPVIAYPSVGDESYLSTYSGGDYYYTYSYPATLFVATINSGPTVSVTFQENGVTPPDWGFSVQGTDVSVTGATNVTIADVPAGASLVIVAANAAASGAYGEEIVGGTSAPVPTSFSSNGTVYFNYSVSWAVRANIMPAVVADSYYEFRYGSQYYEVESYCYLSTYGCSTDNYVSPQEPWYFPNGTVIELGSSGSYGISFWNGTGQGSYTGIGNDANITVDHYLNETGWVGGFGLYQEQFRALGLPATSVYHYTFDGTTYSSAGNQVSYANSTETGTYAVSDIWANSSTPGWEYFGTPSISNPIIVPAEPIVNFSFALVDVGAAAGSISFTAVGLTAGTSWHFGFNGTEYSSSTPTFTLTAHSGTYPVLGYPVVSANGSVGYTPTGLGSSLSVTTGSTYDITFTNAYRVDVQAGNGGSITGTGHGDLWLAAGSTASFHATPASNYLFGGWSGVGTGSYSGNATWANITIGAPITEVASFFPTNANRFNLTVRETGLAAGVWWTVYLGTRGYTSDQPTFLIPNLYPCGSSGTYNLSVPYAYLNSSQLTRFSPLVYPKTTCTNGLTIDTIDFEPQYFLTLQATQGGAAEATIGQATYSTSQWVLNQSSVELSVATNPGYIFLGWNGSGPGSYTGTAANTGLVVNGPMSEVAAFGIPTKAPIPHYWLNLTALTPLAPGTSWAVTVGGTAYASTTKWINVTGLLSNTYPVTVVGANSPDGLTRYTPIAPPTTVPVTKNSSVQLTYSISYWVTVTAGQGGTVASPTAASAWDASGSSIALSAVPNPGYVFLGWVGTGTGSYSGSGLNSTAIIKSPTTEIASFGLAPPATKVVSSSSVWSSPTTWIGLAAIGLVVGALVGLVVGRRRSGGSDPQDPPPNQTDAAPPTAETPMEESS